MKPITYIYYLHYGDNIPMYIGKSTRPKTRMHPHKKKFGDVKMEIIDEVKTSEWKKWEVYYIKYYKSLGYTLKNKNKGGGGSTTQSKKQVEERAQKNRGKKRTPQQRENISKGLKGVVFSEERNKKIGDSQRGIPKNNKTPESIAKLKKPILQFDKNENFIKEWESARDAGLYYGSDTTIQNAIKQRRCKTAYGYIWKYKE